MSSSEHLDYRLRDGVRSPRIAAMTVIVGAVCLQDKAVVLAADRRGADRFPCGPVYFDTDKLFPLGGARCMAFSGQQDLGVKVMEKLTALQEFDTLTGKDLAKAVEDCVDAVRKEEVERCLRWQNPDAVKMLYQTWGVHHRHQEQKMLNAKGWDLSFIIASVDASGQCLHGVTNDCDLVAVDRGFAAIGAGAEHADRPLRRWQNLKKADLATVVYAVFEAKRAADGGEGVGERTDVVIVRQGKAEWLDRKRLADLDDAVEDMHPRDLTAKARRIVADVVTKATAWQHPTAKENGNADVALSPVAHVDDNAT
jgi:hypothetical protein